VADARRYRQRPDLLVREAPGFVAVSRVDGTSMSMADSGAAVWVLLDTPRTIAEVADTLAQTYDVDAAVIATDVEPLLSDLAESGFVAADD
jgi:hypothetical protein